MKIDAIGVTTFGHKTQVFKTAAIGMTGMAAGVAADTFVKGLSKPDTNVEEVVKAYDGGLENSCVDDCCDESYD